MAKRVSVYVSILVAGAVLATVTGCKRTADRKAEAAAAQAEQARQDAEQALFQALDATYAKVNELLEQAQTNEAVALFEALEADPRMKLGLLLELLDRDQVGRFNIPMKLFASERAAAEAIHTMDGRQMWHKPLQ